MRKVMAVILIFLCFGITAFALSSVVQKSWHSRLEKGEYRGSDEVSSVFVIVAVEESTPPDVVISEPLQIIVATPDEIEDVETTEEVEIIGEEPDETVGE